MVHISRCPSPCFPGAWPEYLDLELSHQSPSPALRLANDSLAVPPNLDRVLDFHQRLSLSLSQHKQTDLKAPSVSPQRCTIGFEGIGSMLVQQVSPTDVFRLATRLLSTNQQLRFLDKYDLASPSTVSVFVS
jgi:hypothetical protein